MRFGGVLSKAIPNHTSYAVCGTCNVIYQDDYPAMGTMQCPGCKLPLVRGIDKARALALADESYRELLQ